MILKNEARKYIKTTCGDGWLSFVDKVYQKLPTGTIITQVYQKYGALRFDIEPENIDFETFLDTIEQISEKTCEICGEIGDEKIVNGFVETLCDNKTCMEKCLYLDTL